jgi:hypothetical protein
LAAIAVVEDGATPVTGIVFSDGDHAGGNVVATLSVPSGTLGRRHDVASRRAY